MPDLAGTGSDKVLAAVKQADELLDAGGDVIYNGPKISDLDVRKWYTSRASQIHNSVDPGLSLADRAKEACERRNSIRVLARDMMENLDKRAELDLERPNKTFEELLQDKILRKGMTEEEALLDIYHTAVKTNKKVNDFYKIGD